MIKTAFCKATLALVPVLICLMCAGQNEVAIKAEADRNQILIGERIKLTLEATIPENQPIRFFQIDSFPHFEFISRNKIDTADRNNGTVLSQVIYLTSFDSGHWVIPSFVLGENIATDSIPVDVGYSAFNPQQPYHDIKEIIEVAAEEKKDYTWWYIAGGSLVLLAIILGLLLSKKKKPVALPPVQEINPYREAMKEIELLLQNKPEAKQYYSKLTDIFRYYVFARKGIHSLQKTTDDLMRQLKSLGIPREKFERLSQSLKLGDYVKFAKYIPSPEDDRNIVEAIKTAIDYIEQTP